MKKSIISKSSGQEESGGSKKITTALYVALAMVFCIAMYYSFPESKLPKSNLANAETLRQEFLKAPIPPSTTKIEGPIIYSKNESVLIEGRYLSQLTYFQILDSYKKEMGKNGWVYTGKFGSNIGFVTFCKGMFGAYLKIPPENFSQISYQFSMGWSKDTVEQCSSGR